MRQSPMISCIHNGTFTKKIKNLTAFKQEYQTALKGAETFKKTYGNQIESVEETTFIVYEKSGQSHRIELK